MKVVGIGVCIVICSPTTRPRLRCSGTQPLPRSSAGQAKQRNVWSGTVTLPNRARNKSAGMLGSRRIDDVAPRLHRRGPEGSVRFCGGEMALDVESVVSGCVG